MSFKEFKHVYIETCNKIIEEKGKCISILCSKCPFSYSNQINNLGCVENSYNDGTKEDCEQELLLNSAKEYLKLIKGENDMTKNDLKDGMVVELRNGGKRLILYTKLLSFNGYDNIDNISSYTEDLKHKKYNDYDIVKIYKGQAYLIDEIFKNASLIWEREEKSESEINLEKIQKQIDILNKSVEEFKNEVTKLVCQNIERKISDYIRNNAK